MKRTLSIIFSLTLVSCVQEPSAPPVSADSLFQIFEGYSAEIVNELREDYFSMCPGGSPRQNTAAFWRVTERYKNEIDRIGKKGRSLKNVQIGILDFAHAIDSISNEMYSDDIEDKRIEISIGNRYQSLTTFLPSDTVPLLSEALNVLAMSRKYYPRFKKACIVDPYYPYVEIQPIASADSLSINVGLRVESLCTDPWSFAVVLGDTVAFNYFGTADFTYHTNRFIRGDSLWVNSCVGNHLTGEKSCDLRGIQIGW